MGSVQVALVGMSESAVKDRLAKIASEVGADVSPFNATAGFDTSGRPSDTLHRVTSFLQARELSDAELTAKLVPYQDEMIDPHVGVRFIVSPENIKSPPGS